MAVHPSIKVFGSKVVERAQRNLGATRNVRGKRRRAVASGTLKENLTYIVKQENGKTTLYFTAKGKAKKYAMYVEYGRRPNKRMPPVEAIEKWMKQKPVRVRRNGRIVKQTPEVIQKTAFAIAKKIGRDGIPAVNYYKEAIQDTVEEMRSSIARGVVNDLIKKRFGKNVRNR
jgi:hypothetical protein